MFIVVRRKDDFDNNRGEEARQRQEEGGHGIDGPIDDQGGPDDGLPLVVAGLFPVPSSLLHIFRTILCCVHADVLCE